MRSSARGKVSVWVRVLSHCLLVSFRQDDINELAAIKKIGATPVVSASPVSSVATTYGADRRRLASKNKYRFALRKRSAQGAVAIVAGVIGVGLNGLARYGACGPGSNPVLRCPCAIDSVESRVAACGSLHLIIQLIIVGDVCLRWRCLFKPDIRDDTVDFGDREDFQTAAGRITLRDLAGRRFQRRPEILGRTVETPATKRKGNKIRLSLHSRPNSQCPGELRLTLATLTTRIKCAGATLRGPVGDPGRLLTKGKRGNPMITFDAAPLTFYGSVWPGWWLQTAGDATFP
ncbi:hypothetical protein DFH09DRAFT_1102953 [Mycena vulgaris]|nr:hypothetical protein DFH09DRAFT_1102953 [Mycena vulgaris]